MEEGYITWKVTHKIDRVRRAYAHRSTSQSQVPCGNKKVGTKDTPMPCRYFQRNPCSHKGEHDTNGRSYLYICSTCHSQGKTASHSSRDCRKSKNDYCRNAVPNTDNNVEIKSHNTRWIINVSKSKNESKNWKLDWVKWLGKMSQYLSTNPSSQTIAPNKSIHGFSMYLCQKLQSTKSTNNLKVTVSKDPPYQNIPLHNRFNVFNNADYFSQSALTDAEYEQEKVCLHVDSKSKCGYVENTNVGNSVGSVNASAEYPTQHVVDNLLQVTKNPAKNIKGKSIDCSTNVNASSL